jgi:hypothetical protein
MHYFYSLLLGLIIAFMCSHFAKKRGRNPLHWFIWGALFGVFALVTLFLLPLKKRAASVAAPLPASAPSPLLQVAAPTQMGKLWYYLDQQRQQCGPVSFDGLNKQWADGKLQLHSLVWNDELENWKRLEEVVTGFDKK